MMKFNEISKITGTSKTAVSRVLNNSGYVSSEKRLRIETALRENGYQVVTRHNAIPKSADKIVMIVVETLNNIAYTEYIHGISTCLLQNNLHPFIFVSDFSPSLEVEQIEYATSLGVGGIIMLSAVESPELLQVIPCISCPFVLLNRRLLNVDVDSVVMDNNRVGYLATKYLIEHGHRRILHLAGLSASSAANGRCHGYMEAMSSAGLSIENSIIFENTSYENGLKCAYEFSNQYTAVFTIDDTVASGFRDGLFERGLRCPEDVSIICTENTRTTQGGLVKLTSVGYDNVTMGRTAAELLLERRAHSNSSPKTVSFTPTITERDSVRLINIIPKII